MADLTEVQAAGTTKIVGSDVSGSEQAPIQSTNNGALHINLRDSAGLEIVSLGINVNIAAIHGAISVSTVAIQAKVGASNLVNRKVLIITPTTGPVWWGSNASVTTLTGTKIYKNQTTSLDFTDNVPVYIIGLATTDVRIVECS